MNRRLAFACGALVPTLAGAAFLRGGPSAFDVQVSLALQRTGAEGIWLAISRPGDGFVVPAVVVVLVAAALAARRGVRAGIALVLFCAAAFAVEQGVKAAVARPRPTAPVRVVGTAPTTGSYPSGHVVWFTTLAGGAAVLGLVPRGRRARIAAAAAATACALALGASRVALGHHHATDVLAGYALALAMGIALAVVTTPREVT